MRTPDIEGPRAKAWRDTRPLPPGSIAGYFVRMPGAHAFWKWWYVGVLHLRPIEGMEPAKLDYPEATHEVTSLAINPEVCPEVDVDAPPEPLPFLLPIDVAEQFHGTSDEQAVEFLRRSLEAVCRGELSPDTDFRSAWGERARAFGHRCRSQN